MTARVSALLFGAGGIAFLCAMDAVVKYLSLDYAVLLVTFGRYLVGTAIALIVWVGAGRPPLPRTRIGVHFARGVAIAATAFLFYWSVSVLTLAEAITLSFLAPLLAPLLAVPMLGEKLRWQNFAAVLLGFGGVLVAVQGGHYGGDARQLGVLAALAASLAYALAMVLLRACAADGSVIVTLMGAIIPMLLLTPALFFLTPAARALPAPASWVLFIALGLLGNIGIQLLSRAYARAEAQVLAPLEFAALPWAALFGALVFGEAVAPATWAGGAIIAAACLWSARAPAPIA